MIPQLELFAVKSITLWYSSLHLNH